VVICLFHNLSNYDWSFILKNFDKKYTKHLNVKNDTVSFDDIRAIPLNSQQTLQFQIKNVVFTDSFQFLAGSLDTLTSTLKRDGKDKFVDSNDDMVLEKGHFPYSYFDSLKRLDETSLPPKSAFYNDLTETEISDRDYNHALTVWQRFGMTTFKDYHDFYMKSDVLLLGDCFEAFRQCMLEAHGFDCLYFPTLPNMTFRIVFYDDGRRAGLDHRSRSITDDRVQYTWRSELRESQIR